MRPVGKSPGRAARYALAKSVQAAAPTHTLATGFFVAELGYTNGVPERVHEALA